MEFEPIQLSVDERIDGLLESLRIKARHPDGKDKYIGAYAVAMAEVVEEQREGDFLQTVFTHRPSLHGGYAANLLLRGAQKQKLDLQSEFAERSYPEGYDAPGKWGGFLRRLISNANDYPDFSYDMQVRNIQSNISERYKGIKLAAHMYRRSLGENPTILDIGCSQNLGLKKIALVPRFKFDKVKVRHHGRFGISPILIDDVSRSLRANRLINSKLDIGPSVGVDLPFDERNERQERLWARACSFYPSELLNDNLRRRYVNFQNADTPDKVKIAYADARSPTQLDSAVGVKQKFDLVSLSTILYQLSPSNRICLLENAMKKAKKDGLLVVQDFAKVVDDHDGNLEFIDDWTKQSYSYRTNIIDMKHEGAGFKEAFAWESPRCRGGMQLNFGNPAVKKFFKNY